MNVFNPYVSRPKPVSLSRTAIVTALVCCVFSVVLTLWFSTQKRQQAKEVALKEARSRAGDMQRELEQAASAAELLAALIRQSGTTVDLQRLAPELLAARPGISSLQVEPGGVVSDVAPRRSGDKVPAVNMLADPAQGPGSRLAQQNRRAVALGPLKLGPSGHAIVVRVPVFGRGRDSRESFWGFAAATISLETIASRAQLPDLTKAGYQYLFYAPAEGRSPGVRIAGTPGKLRDPVVQTVPIKNLPLKLALEASGGWTSTGYIVTGVSASLLLSGVVGLLIYGFGQIRALEFSCQDAIQRGEKESAEKQSVQGNAARMQEALAAVQRELSATREALQTSETLGSELRSKVSTQRHTIESLERGVAQAQREKEDLRAKFELALRKSTEELEQAREEVQQANTALNQVRIQAARLQTQRDDDQQKIAELSERVTAGDRKQEAQGNELAQLQTKLAEKTEALRESHKNITELSRKIDERESVAALSVVAHASTNDAETGTAEGVETVDSPKPEEAAENGDDAVDASSPDAPAEVPEPPSEPAPASPHRESEVLAKALVGSDQDQPAESPAVERIASSEFNAPALQSDTPKEAAVAAAAELEPKGEAKSEQIAAPRSPKKKAVRTGGRRKKPTSQMDLFGGSSEEERPHITAGPWEPAAATVPDNSGGADSTQQAIADLSSSDAAFIAESGSAEGSPPETTQAGEEPFGSAGTEPDEAALSRFAEHHAHTAERVRDALESGRAAVALSQLQALQRAAEDIGAPETVGAAYNLAHAIKECLEPAEVESMWSELNQAMAALLIDVRPPQKPAAEPAPRTPRRASKEVDLDAAQFRKAAGIIVPLLADGDPGAKDCFRDNRSAFRPAFSSESYEEFEHCLKSKDFAVALEHLKKAAKRHGILL